MKKHIRALSFIPLLVAVSTTVRTSAQSQDRNGRPRYSLSILGTLGGCCGIGHGINHAGTIAGAAVPSNNAELHAAIWKRGTISDLGTLGGPNSNTAEAQVINDSDMVAGFSDRSIPDPNGEDFCSFQTNLVCLPFLWSKGVLAVLPTLGGNNAQASGVNNRGDVVGVSETANLDACSPNFLQVEAALWRDGNIIELPPLPGDPDAQAFAVNDGGEIIGLSGCATGAVHALVWHNGTPLDLGNLGGEMFNVPSAINKLGQIVGQSDLFGDATHHAFLWDKGVMTDLGTLAGYGASVGNGINNRGQIVGFGDNGMSQVALIWEAGVATDLNTLIASNPDWFLAEALSINDRGEITGFAVSNATGYVEAFALIPCDGNPDAKGCDAGRMTENVPYSLSETPIEASSAVRRLVPRSGLWWRWYAPRAAIRAQPGQLQ